VVGGVGAAGSVHTVGDAHLPDFASLEHIFSILDALLLSR